MTRYATIASTRPPMPSEKLSMSISKPAGVCPSISWSNFLINQPAAGPTSIEAMSIVVTVVSPVTGSTVMPETMAPMTAMVAMMRPRLPAIR